MIKSVRVLGGSAELKERTRNQRRKKEGDEDGTEENRTELSRTDEQSTLAQNGEGESERGDGAGRRENVENTERKSEEETKTKKEERNDKEDASEVARHCVALHHISRASQRAMRLVESRRVSQIRTEQSRKHFWATLYLVVVRRAQRDPRSPDTDLYVKSIATSKIILPLERGSKAF